MSPAALSDAGFADRSMIPVLLRRIRLRSAVTDARASIDALLDLMDQHCEPLACDGASLGEEGVGLTAGDQECGIERGAVGSAGGNAMREDELLQGVKLIAQLLDRVELGIRHGLFSCDGDHEANRPDTSAHGLCVGAE